MPRTVRMICASRSMSRRAALRYKTLQSQELRYAHTLSCLLQLTLNIVRRTVRMICASRSMSRRMALHQMPIAESSVCARHEVPFPTDTDNPVKHYIMPRKTTLCGAPCG